MSSFGKWFLSFSKNPENYKAKDYVLRAKEIKEKKIGKKVEKKKGWKRWRRDRWEKK